MGMSPAEKDRMFRFMTGVVFVVFMIAIFGSYLSSKNKDGEDAVIPVVTAEKTEMKVKPEDEGGMDIQFRETELFDSVESAIDSDKASVKEVETAQKATKDLSFEKEDPNEDAIINVNRKTQQVEDLINSITEVNDIVISDNPSEPRVIKASPFSVFRSQLASMKTKQDAVKAWKTLNSRYPNVLSGFTLHIEKASSAKGTFYRVQTNLTTSSLAENICAIIKPCLVIKDKAKGSSSPF